MGGERGWGGGGHSFEAGRLLTFSAFRMGAYSRWALIRGWSLIRINTVYGHLFYELSRILMRKNVNSDVSKDSPTTTVFSGLMPEALCKYLVLKKNRGYSYPVTLGELQADPNCPEGGLCFPRDQSLSTG